MTDPFKSRTRPVRPRQLREAKRECCRPASADSFGMIFDMNERELIERFGLPDAIAGPEDRLRSTAWICFTCGETTISHAPAPCPAPCGQCGGIMFQTWRHPCREMRRASER